MFISDTDFNNYNKDNSGDYASCSNNVIFETHKDNSDYMTNGADNVNSIVLENSDIQNSDNIVVFVDSNPDLLYNECGLIACTGASNILITDLTGGILGS